MVDVKSYRPLLLLASALLFSLFPRTAHADERAKARTAFHAGLHHYNLGEFKAALESFREAYRHYDDTSFLFNIAQCERQLGHKREAIQEYRAYLNNAGHPDNADLVRQNIRALEKELTDEEDAKRAAAASAPAPAHAEPPPLLPTPPPATTPSPALVAAGPTARAERTPVYKKWWLWTIVGGVAVAGAATGVALALTRPTPLTASTTLGAQSPF
jgi:tetratricopeptide (TPR) repeat protein